MADIATLGFKVDSSGLEKADVSLDNLADSADRADRSAGNLSKTSVATSGALTKMARVAGGVAGILVGMFSARALINGIAEFDSSMSAVAAITGATASELSQLRDVAKDLGATTEFSAAQAADGLKFLGMAGFNAAQSMAALPAVLDLATASGMGLAEAADVSSNIMSGFGIAASNAASVADVLAKAATSANTDVSQLGSAMSTVAPISAALGIGLEDTAAAIGIMSDAGIQGERAGTALRGVMASLAGPTKQARDALAAYGISAQDVNPELHSMSEIFGLLQSRGLSTADAMTIFGREAASGALVLMEANGQLATFGDELRNAEGAAAAMAGTMRDNLGGDLDGLSSSLSSVIIAIGEAGLTGALRTMVQAATAGFRFIAENVDSMRGYVIAGAAAFTVYMIPAIYGAVAATATWVAGLFVLRSALIMTGIGALVVLAGYLINKFITLVENTGSLGEAFSLLGDVAVGVWEGIVASAGAVPTGLSAVWAKIQAGFYTMVKGLAKVWADFLHDIAGAASVIPFMDDTALALNNAAIMAGSNVYALGASADAANESASALAKTAKDTVAAGFATATDAMAKLNAMMGKTEETSTDTADGVVSAVTSINDAIAGGPNGGGGGGGGAGKSKEDTYADDLKALMDSLLTEREAVDAWYAENDALLNDRRSLELLGIEAHNAARLALEEEYQRRKLAVSGNALSDGLSATSKYFGDLYSLSGSRYEGLLKVQKVFAASSALVNAYLAASQTLADPKLGFFGKMAAYGTVLAAGLGLASAIKGSGGGGGTGSTASASDTSADTAASTAPQKSIYIDFAAMPEGQKEYLSDLVKSLYDATGDGNVIIKGR